MIKVTANAMIEAIKHSIVMLQISKVGFIGNERGKHTSERTFLGDF